MKLALGPIPYYWPAATVRAFYAEVRAWPLDTVYLGEVVCGKRRDLSIEAWKEIGEDLASAGKEVVLSTQALMEADSELSSLSRICANERFPVETNDLGAVRLATGKGPFVVGPHINVYNTAALTTMAGLGAFRWVPPVELSRTALADLQAARPAGMETEVFAFGCLPLAFSARCFTARYHNLPKDRCGFRCRDEPAGRALCSQEGQPLFTINGVQLQSGTPANLIRAVPDLCGLGVDSVRIDPHPTGTAEAVHTFREVADDRMDPAAAEEKLGHLAPDGWSNGYWYGMAGMRDRSF